MNRFLMVCALLAASAGAGWAAEQSTPARPEAPSVDAAVAQLGSYDFREREEASRKLWELGTAAVDRLAQAVESADPEVARRARILLDRIRTGIGPDTSDEIVELVQQYGDAPAARKLKVLERLRKLGAFAQIIRLFHFEEDAQVRRSAANLVNGVVRPAAASLIYEGDLEGAVALLRVSPESPDKYRRLAAIFRATGALGAEVARLQGRQDPDERLLLLACYRAQGDLESSLELAREMGDDEVIASLSVLMGDPQPYFDWFLASPDLDPSARLHVEICAERWQGREQDARNLLQPLLTEAREGGDDDGMVARALFLNGYFQEGRRLLVDDPDRRRLLEVYYDGVEEPGKLLDLYGFPESEDERAEWLDRQIDEITANWDLYGKAATNYFGVIGLYCDRGEIEQAARMMEPLATAALAEGRDHWMDFLTVLGVRSTSFSELGFRLVEENLHRQDLGADALEQLGAVLIGWESDYDNFGERLRLLWEFLGDENENAGDSGKRVLDLGKLLGVVPAPPAERREQWQHLLARADQARNPLVAYEALLVPALMRGDSAILPGLLEKMSNEPGGEKWIFPLAEHLSYRHDWEKAEEAWRKFLAQDEDRARASYFASNWMGVLLRRGKMGEAEELRAYLEQLLMDEPAELVRLALAMEGAGLWDEAATYWRRVLLTALPRDANWHLAVEHYLRHAKNTADWPVAAALAQVDVITSQVDPSQTRGYAPWLALRKHFAVSFYRALILLAEDRSEEARRLLDRAVEPLAGDGILADDFFPILRQEGYTELHDSYFEHSYRRISEALELFPNSHNSHNSAAWLASRACRRLDEAEEHAAQALKMRPRQAAYLDTMAEVWFARRNRAKAIEWSNKSMRDAQHGGHNRLGGGNELRAQHDRFLHGEFPVR